MRTKKTVLQGVTREAAEQAFAEFAKADAQYQQLTARMDLEVTRIREKMPTSWPAWPIRRNAAST